MFYLFFDLFYVYDVLEFYIDIKIMEVYYSKYYCIYYDKFLFVIKGIEYEDRLLSEIFVCVLILFVVVCNYGGGYYNYIVYWNCMKFNVGGEL